MYACIVPCRTHMATSLRLHIVLVLKVCRFDDALLLPQVPDRSDTEYLHKCKEAAAAYQRASSALPNEWNYHMYCGKMLAKAGASINALWR